MKVNSRQEALGIISRIPNNALAGKDVNSISDKDLIDLANDLLECEKEFVNKI